MVWIHGGFLQFGNGNEPGISPTAKLAKKMNMVFVSMNYRLYTLGFMALDILTDDILTRFQRKLWLMGSVMCPPVGQRKHQKLWWRS
ncbi:hypothetical protein CEXT_720551 [Caerostris extrusa]|uniref:Carboxylesterase type B domain-containing protein n=1 Tax=Caerostris extrusa TaxID=172846 RepID=A0AAV4N3X5_CAEEX|nr:hypothetical protein CEXT_720551 [Caerostris extrusa]